MLAVLVAALSVTLTGPAAVVVVRAGVVGGEGVQLEARQVGQGEEHGLRAQEGHALTHDLRHAVFTSYLVISTGNQEIYIVVV